MIRFGFSRRVKGPSRDEVAGVLEMLGNNSIVLVGLMGCGKSAIGRRLVACLKLPFVDADDEIEKAAGKSISEIFEDHGEAEFRDGERKVIARLLSGGPQVLALPLRGRQKMMTRFIGLFPLGTIALYSGIVLIAGLGG